MPEGRGSRKHFAARGTSHCYRHGLAIGPVPRRLRPVHAGQRVVDSVRQLLADGAGFSGFVLSCAADGEFCLDNIDLVDDVRGAVYLPALILETSLE